MMPASYTLETLPAPEDPKVTLRQVPARRMAAVRYSGFWSEKNYLQYKLALESWIHEKGFTIAGDPIWARYNPPFTPWFLRRNEVLMKPTIIIAIILIALGIGALAYQGITYTTREKVVDLGLIQVTAEKTKTIPLAPIVGAIAIVGGIVLLVMGMKKS